MKKQFKYKEGVWYKNNTLSDWILLYSESRDMYTGYYAGIFKKFTWTGFYLSDPKDAWAPATRDELNKLGDQWKNYPWIEHYSSNMKETNTPKNYKYAVVKNDKYRLLVIEDLKIPGLKSVTNDIDNIYNDIVKKENDLLYNVYATVFYKGSDDVWSEYNVETKEIIVVDSIKELSELIIYWESSIFSENNLVK